MGGLHIAFHFREKNPHYSGSILFAYIVEADQWEKEKELKKQTKYYMITNYS